MLSKILENFEIYGDEENSFECDDLFKEAFERINDNEIDIQTIFRYLIETTDFLDWIDKTFHNMEVLEDIDEDCTPEENEQISLFNAQADLLKKTQEELKNLKKKYNNLLRKYKDMKSSL